LRVSQAGQGCAREVRRSRPFAPQHDPKLTHSAPGDTHPYAPARETRLRTIAILTALAAAALFAQSSRADAGGLFDWLRHHHCHEAKGSIKAAPAKPMT
jgi:hypothetical protein